MGRQLQTRVRGHAGRISKLLPDDDARILASLVRTGDWGDWIPGVSAFGLNPRLPSVNPPGSDGKGAGCVYAEPQRPQPS